MIVAAADARSARALITAVGPPAAVAATAAGALAVVARVDPNEAGNYPTCPFLLVTGYQCPGCGSLRMLHALMNGDLSTAVDLNVLAVLALPYVAWVWLGWVTRRVTARPRAFVAHPGWIRAFAVVLVVFWVTRNTPVGSVLAA